MKKLILVPLKRNDRVEDWLPYVDEITRPGMKAVFMVPYPVVGFRWPHGESVGNWVERLLDAALSALRPLIRPRFSSVLVINPRTLT